MPSPYHDSTPKHELDVQQARAACFGEVLGAGHIGLNLQYQSLSNTVSGTSRPWTRASASCMASAVVGPIFLADCIMAARVHRAMGLPCYQEAYAAG